MRFRVRDDRAPTSVSARLTVDPATVNPRWLRRSEGALCTSRRCQWQWPLRGVGTAHRGGLSRQVCAEFASLLVTAKLDTPAQLVLFSREGHLLNVLSGESVDGECVDLASVQRPGWRRRCAVVVAPGDHEQRPAGRHQPAHIDDRLAARGSGKRLDGDDFDNEIERL